MYKFTARSRVTHCDRHATRARLAAVRAGGSRPSGGSRVLSSALPATTSVLPHVRCGRRHAPRGEYCVDLGARSAPSAAQAARRGVQGPHGRQATRRRRAVLRRAFIACAARATQALRLPPRPCPRPADTRSPSSAAGRRSTPPGRWPAQRPPGEAAVRPTTFSPAPPPAPPPALAPRGSQPHRHPRGQPTLAPRRAHGRTLRGWHARGALWAAKARLGFLGIGRGRRARRSLSHVFFFFFFFFFKLGLHDLRRGTRRGAARSRAARKKGHCTRGHLKPKTVFRRRGRESSAKPLFFFCTRTAERVSQTGLGRHVRAGVAPRSADRATSQRPPLARTRPGGARAIIR